MAGKDEKPPLGRSRVSRWYRVLADRYLIEDIQHKAEDRWAPKMYRIPVIVPTLIVGTAAAAWTVFVLLARVSGFHVTWWSPSVGSVPADKRGDLVRDTLGVIALFGALLAGIYAYRKQRLEEAAGYRADAAARTDARKELSGRYQDAADQLGHEAAAVRLAGVYAMARLADDWSDQRQTCIDVLSAYVRMPLDQNLSAHETEAEWQIRETIVGLVEAHVQDPASPTSWSAMGFNFRGAHFRPFTFHGGIFERYADFEDAQFRGRHDFAGTQFRGGHSPNVEPSP